jgi:hypothetical protein
MSDKETLNGYLESAYLLGKEFMNNTIAQRSTQVKEATSVSL